MRRLPAGALAAALLAVPLLGPFAAPARADARHAPDDLVVASLAGDVWQVAADGSRRALLATAVDSTGATRTHLALSPDRTSLAYLTGGDALPEVHVQGVRGGGVRIVARPDAQGQGAPTDLEWAGPSALVVAVADAGRTPPQGAQLARVGVQPPAVDVLVGSSRLDAPTVDQADPSRVVAVATSATSSSLVSLVGAGPAVPLPGPLAAGLVASPELSPDGSRLAWLHQDEPTAYGGTAGGAQLVVGAGDGTGASVLPTPAGIDLGQPVWAPDGSAVYVEGRTPQQQEGTITVWRVPVDGSPAQPLALPAELTSSLVAAVPAAPASPVTGATVVTGSSQVRLDWTVPAGTPVTVTRTDGPFGTGPGIPLASVGSAVTDSTVQPGSTYTYVITPAGGAPLLLPVAAQSPPVPVSLHDLGVQATNGTFYPQYVGCGTVCADDVGTLQYAVLDRRSRLPGSFTSVRRDPTGLAFGFLPVRVAPGRAYLLEARGRDEFGNLTTVVRSGPYLAPLDDRSLRVSRGWARPRSKASWQGTLTTTSSAGRTATLAFTGTRVAVLGDRGARYGAAVVTLDGKQVGRALEQRSTPEQSVDVWTSRTLPRGRHVLVLRTTAVGRGRTFTVDGITVTP
ncbi:hypothetical protein EV189_3252 [Motilibacter rhizosphaerae]|uniref:WD40 repeat protein n=1 Tax=Motilibacter rhizosphaerae TaxID=598652 RepID=A0A4Q7NG04_9ACTN|nr:hypothetical protein [Motilibacter rhizosphaerae]RZS82857.1 hypothetical protein EV189_3252 [Motilibacter rhizosphaerae]